MAHLMSEKAGASVLAAQREAELMERLGEMEERIRALEQRLSEQVPKRARAAKASATPSVASSDTEGAPKKKGPKPLAERTPEQQAAHAAKKAARAAEKASMAGGAPAAAEPKPRQQSETQKAWLALVAQTVKEMSTHGWGAWTDPKTSVAWPGSALNPEGQHVYSDGPHAGKAASHQRGGMSRASFIKSQTGLQGEWAEMERE